MKRVLGIVLVVLFSLCLSSASSIFGTTTGSTTGGNTPSTVLGNLQFTAKLWAKESNFVSQTGLLKYDQQNLLLEIDWDGNEGMSIMTRYKENYFLSPGEFCNKDTVCLFLPFFLNSLYKLIFFHF